MECWWKWFWQGKAEVLGVPQKYKWKYFGIHPLPPTPSPKCSSPCSVLKSPSTFRPLDVSTRAVWQCNWVWSTCGLIHVYNIQQIVKYLQIVTFPARSLWFWLCASDSCILSRVWHAITCFCYPSNRYTSSSSGYCKRQSMWLKRQCPGVYNRLCSMLSCFFSLTSSQRTLSPWWEAVAARC